MNEIDIAMLAKFSKGAGRIIVMENQDIPEEIPEKRDESGQMSLPGTLTNDGPWRDAPLSALFTGSLLKSLKEANILTVGDLHDYQQPTQSGFERRLNDIAGIGPSKVELIENKMIEFWRDNPQAEGQVLEGAK